MRIVRRIERLGLGQVKAVGGGNGKGEIVTVTFKRFDAADYLRGAEDIAAYLDVVSEEGDPAQMIAALSTVARAGNVSQLAGDAELTRDPSFTTVSKIARALGLRLELHLQPAEAGQ